MRLQVYSLRTRAVRETYVRVRDGTESRLGATVRWGAVEDGLNQGVKVGEVCAGSPAECAGLEEGEFLLLNASSSPILDLDELAIQCRAACAGSPARFYAYSPMTEQARWISVEPSAGWTGSALGAVLGGYRDT